MIEDCTFLIKSFLRPECLARLLLSIHRHYPNTPTIVVDDSDNSDAAITCAPYPNVHLIIADEKDVGISLGRNIGLMEVSTEFFVLLDDDCVFWRLSDVELMKQRLLETGADIVCGPMCDLDKGIIRQSAMGFLEFEDRAVLVKLPLPLGKEGWVRASNNFFFARTSLREKVLWPDAIKVEEHAPYFWLVYKAGGKVWTSHVASVGHLSTNNEEYDRYRYRVKHRTNPDVLAACEEFRDMHKFTWRTSQIADEFGESCRGQEYRWRRLLEPWCDTQKRFLLLTSSFAESVEKGI